MKPLTKSSSLWNPFSKKGKDARAEAKENREDALKLLEEARANAQKHRMLYDEQKKLADELRRERRRNHFAEMFHENVPLKER